MSSYGDTFLPHATRTCQPISRDGKIFSIGDLITFSVFHCLICYSMCLGHHKMEARWRQLLLIALAWLFLSAPIGSSALEIRKDVLRTFEDTKESDAARQILTSEMHHQKKEKKQEEKRDKAKEDQKQKKEATKDATKIPKDYVLTTCSHHCEMVAHLPLLCSLSPSLPPSLPPFPAFMPYPFFSSSLLLSSYFSILARFYPFLIGAVNETDH